MQNKILIYLKKKNIVFNIYFNIYMQPCENT